MDDKRRNHSCREAGYRFDKGGVELARRSTFDGRYDARHSTDADGARISGIGIIIGVACRRENRNVQGCRSEVELSRRCACCADVAGDSDRRHQNPGLIAGTRSLNSKAGEPEPRKIDDLRLRQSEFGQLRRQRATEWSTIQRRVSELFTSTFLSAERLQRSTTTPTSYHSPTPPPENDGRSLS